MKRSTRISMILALTLVAVVAGGFFVTLPAGPCGPCGGPLKTASGHGSGSSCGAALDAAYQEALLEAYADAPSCVPCQITTGPASCYAIDAWPPTGQYGASQTLYYKCRSCSFDPPEFP